MLPDLTIALMNVVWIILAALSFIGGQVYLFFRLQKLDKFLERRPSNEPTFTYDDRCRYPDEDVVE